MQAVLIYDIPDDRLRTKVAALCADYGLQRIQYSAYLGPITRNRQEELLAKIRRRAGSKPIDVNVFVICGRDLEQRLSLRQEGATVAVAPSREARENAGDGPRATGGRKA